jgi:putative hydrolase of the HAD superfamily
MQENSLFHSITGIIWDLDNTIYKYEGEYQPVFCHAAAMAALDNGFDASFDEAFALAMDGAQNYKLSNHHFLNTHNMPIEQYHHDFHTYINEEDIVTLCDEVHPKFGALFEKKSYKHYILTHGAKEWANRALKALGLREHFEEDMIVGLECVDFVKKHQCHSPFNLVLERMGEKPEHVVMVEDSIENLEKPKELGVKTVWIHHGLKKEELPSYVDHSYETVVEFLDKL